MENYIKLAATLPMPSYLIDDQTAIKVIDDKVEVISEGNWKLITFNVLHSFSGAITEGHSLYHQAGCSAGNLEMSI